MIGAKGSMKKAISLAKAGSHYPPNGLHMLLLGPTGSGKTFFAKKIYQYGKSEGILESDAPLITFNCADYTDNPQLLLSQLFGHKKNAFTGANEDKVGLVELADNGVLLLDEIHRLPPQGQEMLFYLIDNGTFHRLGETETKHKVKVQLICATTENPSSSLLNTFVRRIPMTIDIPSLSDRMVEERIQLAKLLFSKEAERIGRKIQVHVDIFSTLIYSTNYGNVGQLKSNIQIICAQAFLNSLNNKGILEINNSSLSEEMKVEWLKIRRSPSKSNEVSKYLDIFTTIHPIDEDDQDPEEETINLYKMVEEKVAFMQSENLPKDKIQQYILTDIQFHVDRFFKKNDISDYSMLKFVDDKVIKVVEQLKILAEKELGKKFDRRFVYFIAMHIDAFFKRQKQTSSLDQVELAHILEERQEEHRLASLFKQEIEKEFRISLPEIEVIYLTMLISSIMDLKEKKKISVLVATHGNTTATSMVDVATELLGVAPITAVDMPLSQSPNEMLDLLVETIKKIDNGEGVLMLVDMGSLSMHEDKLIQLTGSKIRTITNVSTAMVLDVVRKVNYLDLDLRGMFESVLRDIIPQKNYTERKMESKKIVLTVCSSGKGTAKRLADMVEKVVYKSSEEEIQVRSLPLNRLNHKIDDLAKKYEIVAVIGTKKPIQDVPFISLEQFIEGSGVIYLESLLTGNDLPDVLSSNNHYVVKDLVKDTLEEHLVFLNPIWITDILLEWIEDFQAQIRVNYSNTTIIRCVIHSAFAVERIIKGNVLEYSDLPSEEVKNIFPELSKSIDQAMKSLNLKLTDGEKWFIAESLCD